MAIDFDNPTLYAEHAPETHRSVNPDHTVSEVELPGFLVIGVLLNGVKKELYRVKAGGFLADVERHKQAVEKRQAEQAQSERQTSSGSETSSSSSSQNPPAGY